LVFEKADPSVKVVRDVVGASLPPISVAFVDHPAIGHLAGVTSPAKLGSVVRGSLDDRVEQCGTLGDRNAGRLAESSDALNDDGIGMAGFGPETGERVKRPSKIPVAAAGGREVPVDVDPVRSGDEGPWCEVVVGEDLA
jgi:hypothetical protein